MSERVEVSAVWLERLQAEHHLLRVVAAKATALMIAPYLEEHRQPLAEALAAWVEFTQAQRF